MLKKLVKYGNSNAIILDKAILELLEIEEGSVIKIKTDGKSIIITPQAKVDSQKVNETFTHDHATVKAHIAEGFKQYKEIEPVRKEQLISSFSDLMMRHHEIALNLRGNAAYREEITEVVKTSKPGTPQYLVDLKKVMYKYAPELEQLDQEIQSFKDKEKLAQLDEPHKEPSEEQVALMQQEFAAVHKKNAKLYEASGQLMDNPEYQHQAQLLAEQYGADKNSEEYLKAMDALNDKFLPGFKELQQELKAISAKYGCKASK